MGDVLGCFGELSMLISMWMWEMDAMAVWRKHDGNETKMNRFETANRDVAFAAR